MDKDPRAKAAEAIDRRARQRAAAAAAQQELTPEAIKAEEERQRVQAAIEAGEIRNYEPEVYGRPTETAVGDDDVTVENSMFTHDEIVRRADGTYAALVSEETATDYLSQKLAEAVQPVVDSTGDLVYGSGQAVIQWLLGRSEDNENDYQLALQVQVDEQTPGGIVLDITQQMLRQWREGLQHKDGEKRFAAGIIEKAVELACYETGNLLIHSLQQIMQEES